MSKGENMWVIILLAIALVVAICCLSRKNQETQATMDSNIGCFHEYDKVFNTKNKFDQNNLYNLFNKFLLENYDYYKVLIDYKHAHNCLPREYCLKYREIVEVGAVLPAKERSKHYKKILESYNNSSDIPLHEITFRIMAMYTDSHKRIKFVKGAQFSMGDFSRAWQIIEIQKKTKNSPVLKQEIIIESQTVTKRRHGFTVSNTFERYYIKQILKNEKSSQSTICAIESAQKSTSICPTESLNYYKALIEMKYNELVEFLLDKYGSAKYDYFTNKTCTSKNKKVGRSNEGLVCHHIDEDKAIMLAEKEFAQKNPFEYQKAHRLVYCNLLEHLLLHIKIAEEPRAKGSNLQEIQGIGGAVCFISRQLNDAYNGYEYKRQSSANLASAIKDNYDAYILILRRLRKIIEDNPILSVIVTREELAKGFDGNVVYRVLKDLYSA